MVKEGVYEYREKNECNHRYKCETSFLASAKHNRIVKGSYKRYGKTNRVHYKYREPNYKNEIYKIHKRMVIFKRITHFISALSIKNACLRERGQAQTRPYL